MSQVSQDVRRARFSDRGRCVAVGLTALMMVASSESGCSVGGGVSGGSTVPALGGSSASAGAGASGGSGGGSAMVRSVMRYRCFFIMLS